MSSLSQLEADLAARTADLERARASLRAFASAANHDLNAPLRHIQLFADLIAREDAGRLSSASADYLNRIQASVARSERLVTALVTYARLASTAPELAPTALDTVIAAAVKSHDHAIQSSKAEIHVEALPPVLGDRSLLEPVFEALINNAVTHAGDTQPIIQITGASAGGLVRVKVSDQGPGLLPGQEESAFELLRRLSPNLDTPGEGVGLALCRMVIENHGGRIWIDKDHAPGLSVEFTLQAAPLTPGLARSRHGGLPKRNKA